MQPDEKWVETIIRDMRNSTAYQSSIKDEWYETLPVLQWHGARLYLMVAFGRNQAPGTTDHPVLDRRPLSPHLACLISYPDGQQVWRQSSSANAATFLPQGVEGPRPGSPEPMRDRRAYYRALSSLLGSGALLQPTDQIAASDCSQARSVRELLFKAANPWLDGLYETYVQPLD